VFSIATGNNGYLIGRISLQRVRWFEHRECVGRNEQQPEYERDNRWFICFHSQSLLMRFFYGYGACVGFCDATQEGMDIPSFGRCRRGGQSGVGKAGQIAAVIFISNEGLRATSREVRENLPNAK
jgi:hypothetical protein